MIKIYLAGGMHSGWQDKLKEYIGPNCEYLDPRDHNLTTPAEYVKWDLESIEEANIIFIYLEKSNPGGENAIFELGYATALGSKITILVDEQDRKYMKLAHRSATYLYVDFDEGLKRLKKIVKESMLREINNM